MEGCKVTLKSDIYAGNTDLKDVINQYSAHYIQNNRVSNGV